MMVDSRLSPEDVDVTTDKGKWAMENLRNHVRLEVQMDSEPMSITLAMIHPSI